MAVSDADRDAIRERILRRVEHDAPGVATRSGLPGGEHQPLVYVMADAVAAEIALIWAALGGD